MSSIAAMKAYLVERKRQLLAEYQSDRSSARWNVFGPDEAEEREDLIKSARANAAMDEVDNALRMLDRVATHPFIPAPPEAK